MYIHEITKKIIGCAIEAHRYLAPGLLECACDACVLYELQKNELRAKMQAALPLIYREIKLETGYGTDLVENSVIVEIKSAEALTDVRIARVLTPLKLSNSKIGLLINFNVLRLKDGIKRLIAGSYAFTSVKKSLRFSVAKSYEVHVYYH